MEMNGRIFASMHFLFICISGVPDTSRDAPFEHFHNIWLNTSVIFLSDAKLTTRVRLITHETSGIRSPLSPRAIYYYTLQCRYIQGIYMYNSRSANTAVNIGDMSSISRKTYCRPTTLESK